MFPQHFLNPHDTLHSLRRSTRHKGISAGAIARQANLPRLRVALILAGVIREPRFAEVRAIADAIGEWPNLLTDSEVQQ